MSIEIIETLLDIRWTIAHTGINHYIPFPLYFSRNGILMLSKQQNMKIELNMFSFIEYICIYVVNW